ncbi:MAG: glucose-1-phosphate thymidylyltransferase RfbA [Fidelibacterota bacterium]
MKGIILAGGSGTRLWPVTRAVVKQLLPIYDKPMIYYPLSVLMLAGIRDILIISTPADTQKFADLFGDGSQLGLNLKYKVQPSPDGIAQAFLIGEDFVGDDDVCLILGDNLFFGHGLVDILTRSVVKVAQEGSAVVFGYYVTDPERYGVVEFDAKKTVLSIQEKPEKPASNYAVVGLYFYPNSVVNIARTIKPSRRGELEITTVNQEYLQRNELTVELMGRGYAWLDTGTHESLMQASQFIETIEKRQGLKIGCIEEIAYQKGWIDANELKSLAADYGKSDYRTYLRNLLSDR